MEENQPKYCRQKREGKPDLAFVKLKGKKHYLGEYDTEARSRRFAWFAQPSGRRALASAVVAAAPRGISPPYTFDGRDWPFRAPAGSA